MRAPPLAAALRAVLEFKFLSRKIASKPSMIGSCLRRAVSHLSEPGQDDPEGVAAQRRRGKARRAFGSSLTSQSFQRSAYAQANNDPIRSEFRRHGLKSRFFDNCLTKNRSQCYLRFIAGIEPSGRAEEEK